LRGGRGVGGGKGGGRTTKAPGSKVNLARGSSGKVGEMTLKRSAGKDSVQ